MLRKAFTMFVRKTGVNSELEEFRQIALGLFVLPIKAALAATAAHLARKKVSHQYTGYMRG